MTPDAPPPPVAGHDRPNVGAQRDALDRWVVGVADPLLTGAVRHWLAILNVVTGLFIGVAVLAAPLMALGAEGLASGIYDAYRAVCHQWAFRSFFVFGPQPIYLREQLEAAGLDPFTFRGGTGWGWKLALCERDMAIYSGVLLFGALYAARWRARGVGAASYPLYGLLILPMALDGGTQLMGWRESTWELRLATGALFGVASAWLLYPRLERLFQRSLAA